MSRTFTVASVLFFVLSATILSGASLSDAYYGEEPTLHETIEADVLLRQIANEEDIKYDNVVIVGDLDLHSMNQPIRSEIILANSRIAGKMNLDNVILAKNFDASSSTFLGPTSFINCVFEGRSDFSGCQFIQEAKFGMAKFNDTVKFDSVQFDNTANFGTAIFRNASFSRAKFSKICRFVDSQFIEDANLNGIVFGEFAEFDKCIFFEYAFFNEAKFYDDVNFINSNFSEDSLFNGVQFHGKVNFEDSKFQNAYFEGASFSEAVNFKNVSFGGDARFYEVDFDREVDFSKVNFSRNSSFSNADFSGGGSFEGTVFNGHFSLRSADFSDLKIPWTNIVDRLVDDRETYTNLMRNYRDLGWYTDFGGCYYQYRDMIRLNKSWSLDGLSKAMDTLAWFYGYGVRPYRAIVFILFLIVIFAIVYELKGDIKRSKKVELNMGDSLVFTLKDLGQKKFQILFDQEEDEENTNFKDSLYFSANTFIFRTTATLYPQGICIQIAKAERLIGIILFGLLLTYVTNQICSYFQPPI